MRIVHRLLSIGQSPALSESLSRHTRIANALALIGVAIALASVPFDAIAGTWWVALLDVVTAAGFAACWLFNHLGRHTLARVTMLLAANATLYHGTSVLGDTSDLRVIFFALVILPFLIFDLAERAAIAVLVCVPIIGYALAGTVSTEPPQGFSSEAYRVYAALVTFVALIASVLVFTIIQRRADRALRDRERQLAEAHARAASAARLAALGEMSGGIAHEIRNPLAAISLAAAQLVEAPHAPESAQHAERIQRVVARISKIVDGLLSFARDAGGDPFVPVAVERVVTDALDLCRKRFADHGIALEVSPIPAELTVECRAVQISQVLLNLLSNAHDAVEGAAGSWVRLEVRRDGDAIEIAVTDSGPGIPEAVRQKLFEPFFTTKPPDRGTGLGLSMSRGIVVAHHGTLTLDETSPHTRFVVRLPSRHESGA